MDFSRDLSLHQPQLPTLAKFLMREAQDICNRGAVEPLKTSRPGPSFSKRPLLLTSAEEKDTHDYSINVVSDQREMKCVFCDNLDHTINSCSRFKSEDVDQRWEWICKRRLCFKCLKSTHRRDRCKSKTRCLTCKGAHHTLLHRDDWNNWSKKESEVKKETTETTANVWAESDKKVFLKVLPIIVEGPEGCINTYALLDEGSTVTLVESQIAEKIGATGPEDGLNLQGAIGRGNNMISQIVTLTIRTSETTYKLNHVRTVKDLKLPRRSVTERDISQYDHLQGIPIHTFVGRPTILIGQDNWQLIISREIIEGKKNEPVASLTKLGWVLHGFVSSISKKVMPEFTLHIRQEDELHNLVNDYFRLDSIGIRQDERPRLSPEERRSLNILDTKSKKIKNRWETGLLWRSDDTNLPNNKRNAELRLRTIEKMMNSDPGFATDYTEQVDNMLEKDYAQEVCDAPTGRVWYLPHFGVRNPNKPGKQRLVFDAKAETKGVSLNTELLTGPDLLNSLLGVLLRFRERPVAVTADIREMFLQIKIIEEDQNAQCFLWRGKERVKAPSIYKMTSMTFGAKSSPCTATYIIRRNADGYAMSHPRAVEAIKKRHYVDDYLDSLDNEEEMKQLVKDVIMIHQAGGFEICSWASNRPNVLPDQANAGAVSILKQSDDTERTLGLNWKPTTDTLGFDLSLKKVDKEVVNGSRRPSKREILKTVMSVFDPLGMLCPFLIRGKIMLQEIWRNGIQWDQQLDEKSSQTWFRWLRDLKECKTFSIPRCYGFSVLNSLQLHVFVDASEQAYACVAYLRRDQEVAFVAAKSRVAPLKSATIPRLELQGALMGARLGHAIQKELGIAIEKRVFWTDSKTVWLWINKNPRQTKAFVTNRLAEIDELTQTVEWRWLPGNLNVADEATRSEGNMNSPKSRWILGPEFLRLSEDNWPKYKPQPKIEEETKPVDFVLVVSILDVHRFSNWRRLVRGLAYAILFTEKCRRSATHLTPDHECRAQTIILRQVQSESFGDEIADIKNGLQVKPQNRLRPLNPGLDETGILRMQSRLEASMDFSLGLKRPVILDARHYVVKLIIEHKHRELGHHGTGTLINELRQQYYIFRLRGAVRSLIARCITCKARRGRCEQPLMAGLPFSRLQHHCRPFTYCGVDLFGPMTVTIGRRHEKRWGVLFTCFSTRAVHVELAASLSTDSTILAIRRMAARRGLPKQIHSDNGTNFRSADKELQKAIQDIICDGKLMDQVSFLGIKWTFNPPDAPHMGGVWERLVRSIKTALSATLHTRTPKEEVLATLLAEAENIVNSRPLTHVSLHHDDEEALTPNHFLLGASNGLISPGDFSDDDNLRKQWRTSQRLADHFWSRWVREYMPTLQTRKKWTTDDGRKVGIGDLILIADSNSPRNVWPRGRVSAITPGRDGRVRTVDVTTRGGTLRRPVCKVIVLLRADEASPPEVLSERGGV